MSTTVHAPAVVDLAAERERRINARADAFHRTIPFVARDGVVSVANLQRAYEQSLARRREQYGPAASTLMAADYLAGCGDPRRLERWLMARPPQERAAILAHLRSNVCKD